MKPIGNIFGFDCVTCEHNRNCYGGNMGNQFRYCQKSIEKVQNLDKLEQENKQLKEEIRKYQKDRDINTKRHLEVQDYIKSRIQYCKEMTGFDCCIEELEEISKMI